MDWRSLILIVLKAALRVWADEVDPANRRRGPDEKAPQPKEAPPPSGPPPTQQAEQSAASAGWSAPTEPPPVTVIRIETDAGATISPISFVGDQGFGTTRTERERGPGESRRVRRKPPVEVAPRAPWMDAFAERTRAEARATVARREEEALRVNAAQNPPIVAHRRRRAGEWLTNGRLSPATLRLLDVGEPMTHAVENA